MRVMLRGMRWVLVAMLLGCAHEAAKPAPPPTAQRQITPRAKLPAAIVADVPQHGIYVAGGGLTSAPWRVVVDYDKQTIYAGSSTVQDVPSNDRLVRQHTTPLTAPNKEHLAKLAEAVWHEPAPATPGEVTADYDELIVVADGEDCFYLDNGGPITADRRPAAAKLIEDLRAAGAL